MVNWKVIAIVFIIIAAAEGLYFCWAWNYGNEMIENENDCSINVCGEYDAYYYDYYTKLCTCYQDHEEVKYIYYK